MIIETNEKFDSRFVLYDLITVLSELGSVHVITSNHNFANLEWDNNILVEKVPSDKVVDTELYTEDYIIADNVSPTVRDMSIYFIDPYSYAIDNGDLTMIPKDATIVRVCKGVGNRIDFKKLFSNEALLADENNKYLDQELAHEYISMKARIDADKDIVTFTEYEDILFFEMYHYLRKHNRALLNKLNKVGNNFLNKYSPKGVKNERSNKKFQQILW